MNGFIELVPHFTKYDGKIAIAYCNEEGRLKPGFLINRWASMEWRKQFPQAELLLGNIAITTRV